MRLVQAHQEALHSVTGNGHSHTNEEEVGVVQIRSPVLLKRMSSEEILERANRADASTQLV